MELPGHQDTDHREEPQSNAAHLRIAQSSSPPPVRELTAGDMDEQRRLVRASLLGVAA